MSILIEKAGLLDTLQDEGRIGFQQLGINPNGHMDWEAAKMANILAANPQGTAIIECHFPAPILFFQAAALVGLAGADFEACIDDGNIAPNRTILVPAGARLLFRKKKWGERLYIAVNGGFNIEHVLGSYSTNLKACFGGWQGRALQKGDGIPLKNAIEKAVEKMEVFPWFLRKGADNNISIRVMHGPEWKLLTEASKEKLQQTQFRLLPQSDRMAYRWMGPELKLENNMEMVSSPVVMGTMQLLPNGRLLTLMADHQTVGGYPRVLQVIKADLPKLAQMPFGSSICFEIVEMAVAKKRLTAMEKDLRLAAMMIKEQLDAYLR